MRSRSRQFAPPASERPRPARRHALEPAEDEEAPEEENRLEVDRVAQDPIGQARLHGRALGRGAHPAGALGVVMREIINLEVRLHEGADSEYEVALMWGDCKLRSWPIDGGRAYVFEMKPHQFREFVAAKLAECLGAPADPDWE